MLFWRCWIQEKEDSEIIKTRAQTGERTTVLRTLSAERITAKLEARKREARRSPPWKHIHVKISLHNHLIHIIFSWHVTTESPLFAEEKIAIALWTLFPST